MKTTRRIQRIFVVGAILTAMVWSAPSAPAQNGSQGPTPNPYLKPDESWISISGQAVNVQNDSFTLDYGKGIVTVEMDGWNWYEENFATLEGDKVTVYGRIDDDMFESTKINASSIYVETLGTYFYASAADEDFVDSTDYWVSATPIRVGQTTVRGTITGIDGREFTIDTGEGQLVVDTLGMSYNPLDDMGYQTLDVGDYVSVTGTVDENTWKRRELMAENVTTLFED